MKVEQTELEGVLELTPSRFGDERGWFSESWNAKTLAAHGIGLEWVQDNESLSADAGTLRGIHFQIDPHAQDKLVRVVSGRIFDVAVDLRRSSSTFGQWVGRELSAEVGNQLLVPRGFGHAFLTLTPQCHVVYKVTSFYEPESDRSLIWNDSTIAIDWPIEGDQVVLSAKDAQAASLNEADELFD